MKKYLVIGNPIDHSLSPQLHNHWIKVNKIEAVYEKKKINQNEIKDLIRDVKDKKISGINVTVPFKQEVITYLDELTDQAQKTQSVNTIYLGTNGVIGHNTDVDGFESSLKDEYDPKNKNILILGAGGVVPSIIFALKNMKAESITISNRTREKAENLKKSFGNIKIVNWGQITNFDMIINATSVGLKEDDNLNLDFTKSKNDKFYYDVIYNPKETNFLKMGKKLGNKTENGKKMFIYQAAAAFKIWHGFEPIIDDEIKNLLEK